MYERHTLLKPSHSIDVLAVPSHLLIFISREVEPNSGIFVDNLLGFQPSGLSEIPLYRENSFGVSDRFIFLLSEEVREGIGPAMLKAKDMLMFILRFRELTTAFVLLSPLVTYPRQELGAHSSVER